MVGLFSCCEMKDLVLEGVLEHAVKSGAVFCQPAGLFGAFESK